jgi:tetratricopeptide (TPR) repeat protein
VAAAVAGLTLAGAIVLGAGDMAVELSGAARDAGHPDQARRHGALAVAVTPWNDMAHATYGQALSALGRREEAVGEFGAARRLGRYEPWYAELQAQEYRQMGRLAEAAGAYGDEAALWPWYVPVYETALSAHLDMLFRAQVLGDAALANELTGSGRAILAALDRQKAKEPPGRPRKPMDVHTPAIEQARDYFK